MLFRSREGCPWCDRLKDQLKEDGVSFKEITKEEASGMGIWKSDWQTVPQLWLRGEHIGGYTDYVNRNTYASTESQECEACHA